MSHPRQIICSRAALARPIIVLAATVALAGCGGSSSTTPSTKAPAGAKSPTHAGSGHDGSISAPTDGKSSTAQSKPGAGERALPPGAKLAAVTINVIAHLPMPIDKTAATMLDDGTLVVAGGLVGGTSSTSIITGTLGGGASKLTIAGHLPTPLHDAAMAHVGARVLHMGGGATMQYDGIRSIDPATGAVKVIGHLPRPASDLSAVTVGADVYAVGGYDGAKWLDTITRVDPTTGAATVVAHLPAGVRYAAVASFGGANEIYIAGGTLATGADSTLNYVVDVSTGKVRALAPLAHPTAHAGFAIVGGALVLVGGRVGTVGAHELRQFDPATGATRIVGHLASGIADPAIVNRRDNTALLVGGSTAAGSAADTITELSAP